MRYARFLFITAVFCGLLTAGLVAIQFLPGYVFVESFANYSLIIAVMALVALLCSYLSRKILSKTLMHTGCIAATSAACLFGLLLLTEFFTIMYSANVWTEVAVTLCSTFAWAGVITAILAAHWGTLSLVRLDRPANRIYCSTVKWLVAAGLMIWLVVYLILLPVGNTIPEFIVEVVAISSLILIVGLYFWGRVRQDSSTRTKAFASALAFIVLLVVSLWHGWVNWLVKDWSVAGVQWYYLGQAFEWIGLLLLLASGIVPVLGMFEAHARRITAGSIPSVDLTFSITCPRCGLSQSMRSGKDDCDRCGLVICTVIEEPKCECGYVLYLNHGDTCPECGRTVRLIDQA